jgi:hypothetical protein
MCIVQVQHMHVHCACACAHASAHCANTGTHTHLAVAHSQPARPVLHTSKLVSYTENYRDLQQNYRDVQESYLTRDFELECFISAPVRSSVYWNGTYPTLKTFPRFFIYQSFEGVEAPEGC